MSLIPKAAPDALLDDVRGSVLYGEFLSMLEEADAEEARAIFPELVSFADFEEDVDAKSFSAALLSEAVSKIVCRGKLSMPTAHLLREFGADFEAKCRYGRTPGEAGANSMLMTRDRAASLANWSFFVATESKISSALKTLDKNNGDRSAVAYLILSSRHRRERSKEFVERLKKMGATHRSASVGLAVAAALDSKIADVDGALLLSLLAEGKKRNLLFSRQAFADKLLMLCALCFENPESRPVVLEFLAKRLDPTDFPDLPGTRILLGRLAEAGEEGEPETMGVPPL